MIPGPTPVHEQILSALARPTTSHQFPSFVETFRDCLEQLKRIVFTETAQPFIVAGAGTLAMEMALVNIVGSEDRILILSHGYFGDRWVELAEAFGIDHDVLRADWGRAVPAEQISAQLGRRDYSAVAITHVDTSTGTAAPIHDYVQVLRGRDCLTILDGVCATGGIEERFDDWSIDLLLTGAQKAFGAPPGLAILLASQRAMARRRERSVSAYYADLMRWLPIMEDPARYFSTPPVNEVLALHAAAGLILGEGLENRFRRHARIASAMRSGLDRLGLSLFTDESCRADTLSVVRHAEGVDDAAFRAAMAAAGVVIAGGLGPLAGRAFRIGHMGNIGSSEVRRTLQSLASSLESCGLSVDRRGAVEAAEKRLDA